MNVDALQRHLLAWAEAHRRDLPWRSTRDPWAVLVSELMLQQTQVDRVVPKYEAFMKRFPTPQACATAPAGAVVEAWAGLGYNRRAINLHRSAVLITERLEGRAPTTVDAWLALPGIGPYTARAVMVFAYEADCGVVDTNVARILARWQDKTLTPAEEQSAADALIPAGQAWAWTQGLFDLGASVCGSRSADCDACPVQQHCGWAGVGDDPATAPARQSTFVGSDRQGRGRLVDALRRGPVAPIDVPVAMGWPEDPARAQRVAQTLVDDGLAVVGQDASLSLP